MPVNLEQMEKRLVNLEYEVATLRDQVGPPVDETPAERGARALRQARANQAALSAGWVNAMKEMGIVGSPIGANKVQDLTAAFGMKPEDNELSRGIIAMREE